MVTWVGAQLDTQSNDAWKSLAERSFLDNEVTAAKEALKNAKGAVLENLYPEFKTKRSGGGKKSKEIEDIEKALVTLQGAGEMPLVLASSSQMVRCPQSWGVPPTATVQDVMGKVIMLEQAMENNIKSQKEHLELLREEMIATRRTEPKTPAVPAFLDIMIAGDTPSKKRKLGEKQSQSGVSKFPTYAGVTMQGVQQQKGMRIPQSILQNQQQPHQKPQRNICYGSAKTDKDGAAEKLLAADVSLVASGVGKGCTEENLKDFLIGRGITPVEVEMLTKPEVLDDVRTITFRVAVKPADYEAALKPDVWPYRVAVRHYRAPRRDRAGGSWQAQSERTGGQISTEDRRNQSRGLSGTPQASGGEQRRQQTQRPPGQANVQYLPPGHAGRVVPNQQKMSHVHPGPIEMNNLYSLLSALGGEMPSYQ